jgi:hypothetical protein
MQMGAMKLPDPPRKPRWGWLLVWTLMVFAGGVASSPILLDLARPLIARGTAITGNSRPVAVTVPPAAPVAPEVVALPATEAPRAPVRTKGPSAAQPAVAAPAPAAPTTAEESAHTAHGHTTGKSSAPSTGSTRTGTDPNPFEDGAEKTAAKGATHKSKPMPDDLTAAPTKPAPAGKSSSHDPLDSLMLDTPAEGKGKKQDSKNMDALLKEVQKGKPEPAARREVPAEDAPSLTASDIARVMGGLKVRGKECARTVGQTGVAEMKLAVAKDGSVSSASVGGKLAGTPLAACIEKAARSATFPRSNGLRFDYRLDVR